MKSIKRRFNNISRKCPYWSSYVCFTQAIKEQNFKKRTVRLWFKCLVEKDDYDPKDKRTIFRDLENLKLP